MPVDDVARQMMRDHELLCAERFGSVQRQLGVIIKVGGWAGGMTAMAVLASLGYLAKGQIDNTQHQINEIHATGEHVVRQVTTGAP